MAMLLSPLQFEGEEGSSVGERVVISRVWKPNLATMSADALAPALVVAEQHGADDAMEIIQNNFNEYARNKLEKFGVSTNAAIQGNLLPRPTRTPSPRAECKRPHLGSPCNRRLMATMSADTGPMMAAQNLSDRSIPTPNRAQAPMSPEEEEATANIDDEQSLEATEPMGFDWIQPTADDVRQAADARFARQEALRSERVQCWEDAGCPSPSTTESITPTPPRPQRRRVGASVFP